jgi:hypothetical protein
LETLLVEPKTAEVFYLDEVTSALWCFLTEPRHNVEIVPAFTEAFPDTGRDRIAADIAVALVEWICGAFLEEKFDYVQCIVPGHTITVDIDVGPNPYRDRYRCLLPRYVELSRARRRVPRGPLDLINSLGRALTKSGNTGRAITLARDICTCRPAARALAGWAADG